MRIAALADAPLLSEGGVFAVGAGFIVLGTILHWRLNHVAMRVEEDQKERVITEEQARRRLTIATYSGPLTISLGIIAWGILLWK